MPTNIPPRRRKTPKWRPEKDPRPISRADEDIADGLMYAGIGCITFVLATLFGQLVMPAEHADIFRGASLLFMAGSGLILWRSP